VKQEVNARVEHGLIAQRGEDCLVYGDMPCFRIAARGFRRGDGLPRFLQGFAHQLPADAADYLFAPGKESGGGGDAAGRYGAAEHAGLLDQERRSAGPACLDGGNHSGCSSADHDHVIFCAHTSPSIWSLFEKLTGSQVRISKHEIRNNIKWSKHKILNKRSKYR
jgi:hypothetical protein